MSQATYTKVRSGTFACNSGVACFSPQLVNTWFRIADCMNTVYSSTPLFPFSSATNLLRISGFTFVALEGFQACISHRPLLFGPRACRHLHFLWGLIVQHGTLQDCPISKGMNSITRVHEFDPPALFQLYGPYISPGLRHAGGWVFGISQTPCESFFHEC